MELVRQPSLKKLEKLARKTDWRNKTVLHYTGGMFGIGCTLSSEEAITRIRRLKQRQDQQGFIVLIPDLTWLDEQEISVPERLRPLLEQYWPGNLSVVFACSDPRFEAVAVNGKVAFRVPEDAMLRAFIEMLGEPLLSTSVNVTNLPPENDLKRLTGIYASWFDYGLLPADARVEYDTQPSTIVEFVSSREAANQSGMDELKCLREGSIAWYGVKKSFTMPVIMFVCTANICRSPIAEKLFNHYALKEKLHLAGDSCGLLSGGQSISASSMQLLLELGILEARDHISKQVTPEMLTGSKLVLTMEERQRDYLLDMEPRLAHKIMTLNEYLDETGDIIDPYGSDLDYYRQIFEIIDDRVKRLIEKLKGQEAPEIPESSYA